MCVLRNNNVRMADPGRNVNVQSANAKRREVKIEP